MSVVKNKRGVSDVEFLNNARKLEIFTLQKCVNTIPKRYTFYLGQPIAKSATDIYSYVKKGNSIYPVNAHEVQLRRDCFMKAYVECQSLISQIEVAYELLHFNTKILEQWAGMIGLEIKLIRALMRKDRQRYKSLQ